MQAIGYVLFILNFLCSLTTLRFCDYYAIKMESFSPQNKRLTLLINPKLNSPNSLSTSFFKSQEYTEELSDSNAKEHKSNNKLLLFFYVLTGCGISFTFTIILYFRLQKNKLLLKKEKESEKLLSRFIENITHDLKTPLTLMFGPLELLEENAREQDKRLISACKKNTKKLLNLVNQLLDIAKYDAGKLELVITHNDIIPLLKASLASFQDFAESDGVLLKFESKFDSYKLYSDMELMERIISNLLSNAIKFTPKNGMVTLKVSEEIIQKKNHLIITIKDTGIGISKENIPLIFNRYYQTEKSKEDDLNGTGIGLSLVKELVLLHKGKITVESEICQGSTFTLSFPTGKEQYNELQIVHKSEKTIEKHLAINSSKKEKDKIAQSTLNNEESIAKKVILVIDDHPDIRTYIRAILSKEYTVIEAENGKSGINKANKYNPSLIICDIMMPKMNGFDFCKVIKNNDKTSTIPIVIVSAKNSPEDHIKSLELQVDSYLTKPFKAKELQATISNLLRIRESIANTYINTSLLLKQKSSNTNSATKSFIENIIKEIDNNISNEQFGVEELSNNIGISRSQLQRKLKAAIDQNPNQLIRNYRLEKAFDMLKNKVGNISEIAFQVGFSSPSYFTKCFTEKFGYTPNEIPQHQQKVI